MWVDGVWFSFSVFWVVWGFFWCVWVVVLVFFFMKLAK